MSQSIAARRGYAGVDKLRKLLRKVDPEIVVGVQEKLEQGAQAIHFDMLKGAPVQSGDLAASIAYKMSADRLSIYIGPGADRASVVKLGFGKAQEKYTKSGALSKATILDNEAREQLYKANWAEFGTKAREGHPGQPARPFIGPAYDANKASIISDVQAEIGKALSRASRE